MTLGIEKFMSPEFELGWLPPTVDLGSERPADQLTFFACLILNSGAWFRVLETVYPRMLEVWLWKLR